MRAAPLRPPELELGAVRELVEARAQQHEPGVAAEGDVAAQRPRALERELHHGDARDRLAGQVEEQRREAGALERARRAGVGVGVGHHADLLQRGTARVGAQHVGRDRDVERPVAPGERNLALELGARALGTRALERSHARGTCRGE